MFRFIIKFSVLIILLFSITNYALAWDEIGHKLTAYIAWERMNPEVREKVVKILLAAPEDSDLSVRYDAYNSRSDSVKRRELFMYAAIWSDVIRNRDFEVRFRKYNQSDWHYADIFWKQENNEAVILADFPVESGKAIPKLYDFEKILQESSYNNEEKSIALAWFLHVGGDIHNPVHNASRVTELEPKGDQGGNLFVFIPRTETSNGLNLHGFWDSIIGQVKPRKNDACDSDYLAPIAEEMMKKHPYSKMQSRLSLGNYKLWNIEGFNFLNKVVYTSDLQRNQMPSKKYTEQTFVTAEEQITLAGYRLGETLNRIFGSREVSSKTTDDSGNLREVKDSKNVKDSVGQGANDTWIWTKTRAALASDGNLQNQNLINVDVNNGVVTLKGTVSSLKQKELIITIAKNVEGVKEVKDLIKIK
jgi:osmotically-inducible protein OsmY